MDIFNTIINSEAFLIVISGVLIFAFQKLLSQLWIAPTVDFKKCLSRIESSLNRWDFLYIYTEGKNNLIGSDGISMDERIKIFRKELNDLAFNLISTYNALPIAERFWIKTVRRINIKDAKHSILTLSTNIAREGDWKTSGSKAKSEIKNLYKHLKLSRYLQSPF